MARLTGWQARWDGQRVRLDRVYRREGPPTPSELYPEPGTQRTHVAEDVTVTRYRRDTSHLFHLVMTVLTGGLWIFVWAFVTGRNKMGPRRKAVTRTRRVVVGSP